MTVQTTEVTHHNCNNMLTRYILQWWKRMFCFAAFKNGNRTSLSLFVFLKTEFALPFYDLLNVDKRSSLDVEHHPVTLRKAWKPRVCFGGNNKQNGGLLDFVLVAVKNWYPYLKGCSLRNVSKGLAVIRETRREMAYLAFVFKSDSSELNLASHPLASKMRYGIFPLNHTLCQQRHFRYDFSAIWYYHEVTSVNAYWASNSTV